MARFSNKKLSWLLSQPCPYQSHIYIYIYIERERERGLNYCGLHNPTNKFRLDSIVNEMYTCFFLSGQRVQKDVKMLTNYNKKILINLIKYFFIFINKIFKNIIDNNILIYINNLFIYVFTRERYNKIINKNFYYFI